MDSDDEGSYQEDYDESEDEELTTATVSCLEPADTEGDAEKKKYQEDWWQLKKLPYSDELFDQAEETFQKIKFGLAHAVVQHDLDLGLVNWLTELALYVSRYGLRFTKEDHLFIINLIIPMVKPKQIYTDTMIVMKSLIQLMRKTDYLTREDLIIDWEPLFDLFVEVKHKPEQLHNLPEKFVTTLSSLVQLARAFFGEEAPREIWKRTRPFMCPSNPQCAHAWYTISTFLPMNFSDEVQKTHGAGLWFEETWRWYSLYLENNENVSRANCIFLFARLAEEAPGYVQWSEERLSVIFTRLIRGLALPNSDLVASKSFQPYKYTNIIAYLLGSSSHESLMKLLGSMCKLLESSSHPSNSSAATKRIEKLFTSILNRVLYRVRRERRNRKQTTMNPVPERMRLEQKHLDELVTLLLPCVKLLLFGKGRMPSLMPIRNSCLLAPKIVLPMVLDMVYPSLETLIEPHRLHSVLSALSVCVHSLVTDDEHRIHAIRVLKSLLPGIDQNDVLKMAYSVTLVATIFRLMKIADCSAAVKTRKDLSKEEKMLCRETAHFKQIIIDYMDRLLDMVQRCGEEANGSHHLKNKKQNIEEIAFERGTYLIFNDIFANSSTELYEVAFEKLFTFISSSLFDNANVSITLGRLVSSAVRTNPEYAFPRFLKLVTRRLKENISKEGYNEEKPDFAIVWWLKMTNYVIEFVPGDLLVKHWEEVKKITESVTPFAKVNDASETAGTILKEILRSLCGIKPIFCVEEREKMNKPLGEYLPIRHWAETVDRKSWTVNWSVPNEERIQKAEELFILYFQPSLDALKTPEKLNKRDMELHLDRIKQMFVGAAFSIPEFDGKEVLPMEMPTFKQPPPVVRKPKGTPELRLNGKSIRHEILDVFEKLVNYVSEHAADDVKNISIIAYILELSDSFKGMSKGVADSKLTIFKKQKSGISCLEKRRIELPQMMTESLSIAHCLQITAPSGVRIREEGVRVMRLLIRMATSAYSQNRKAAQRFLKNMWNDHTYSFEIVRDEVLALLAAENKSDHEKIKGALYLLHLGNSTHQPDFKNQLEVCRALILVENKEEKKSIIKIVDDITNDMCADHVTHRNDFEVDEKSMKLAMELLAGSEELLKETNDWKKKKSEAVSAYTALNEELSRLCNAPGIHWRQEMIALNFLSAFMNDIVPCPSSLIETFLARITHDHSTHRVHAVSMVCALMRLHKPKAVKKELKQLNPENGPFPLGVREENRWVMYEAKKLPKSDEEWDKFQFVRRATAGFYTWKEPFVVTAPLGEQVNMERNDAALSKEEEMILERFKDKEFLMDLKNKFTIEGLTEKDNFNGMIACLFRYLTRSFGDRIVDPMKTLISSIFPSTRRADHRFAAEIVGGVIRGSRLWRWSRQRKLWEEWLTPLLKDIFDRMVDECVTVWQTMIIHVAGGTDPRALPFLIELLFSRLEGDEQAKSVYGLQTYIGFTWHLLDQLGWRAIELAHRLYAVLLPMTPHKMQIIRSKTALCLMNGTEYNLRGVEVDPSLPERLRPMSVEKVVEMHGEMLKPCWDEVLKRSTNGEQLLKTSRLALSQVALFIDFCLKYSPISISSAVVDLLPLLCYYQNDVGDQDLMVTCNSVITSRLRSSYVNAEMVVRFLSMAEEYLLSPTYWWKAKGRMLSVLQFFVIDNFWRFQAKSEEIENLLMKVLCDGQLEVANMARDILKDFYLSGFLEVEQKHLDHFLSSSSSGDKSIGHGGVLGLSAVVLAAPYSVPAHMPSVLMNLAALAGKDQLYQDTVKKTFAEFRRTHQDCWHEHKEHFDERELEELAGFLTPSNYFV